MMLEGLLLDLVPFDKRFVDRIVDWRNGPMREWWNDDGLLARATHRRWLQERPPHHGRHSHFGMLTKDGVPIGSFGIFGIDYVHRQGEVGAGIGNPAYWSGGYGSDAMLLICEYAFNMLDLRRLYLDTFGHNFRAQRQVEKCGFVLEARQRGKMCDTNGVYRDWLHYGLLRDEWPGREVMVERLGLRDKARALGLPV
jgi:RimJ/RimL family protein N-acetyltransferase